MEGPGYLISQVGSLITGPKSLQSLIFKLGPSLHCGASCHWRGGGREGRGPSSGSHTCGDRAHRQLQHKEVELKWVPLDYPDTHTAPALPLVLQDSFCSPASELGTQVS